MEMTTFQKEIAGKKVDLYTLRNRQGAIITISNFGATIINWVVPDKNGTPTDIILGFDTIEDVITHSSTFMGSTIGRYANRIAKGQFKLDDTTYQVTQNNGENHLHGGKNGFYNVVWDVVAVSENTLRLAYRSPAGEEGYPGNLQVSVTFTLTDDNACVIAYEATTDSKTLCNLTQHAYFNLNGAGKADTILNNYLQIFADKYTPIDENAIPLGFLAEVEDTPFDFRKPKMIGKDIDAPHEQLAAGKGYDHNFAITGADGQSLKKAAVAYSNTPGICLEIFTTEYGIQLYSGNFLDGSLVGKEQARYAHRKGFCLETQNFPDSPNQPAFPSSVLASGEVFRSTSIYKCTTLPK